MLVMLFFPLSSINVCLYVCIIFFVCYGVYIYKFDDDNGTVAYVKTER